MKKILIFENDDKLNSVLSMLLTLNNYKAYSCGNGKSVYTDILTIKPDLIIAESAFPGFEASELLYTLHLDEIPNDLPCILLTTNEDDQEYEHLMESGAKDVILKPFIPKQLLMRIEQLIGPSVEKEDFLFVNDMRIAEHSDILPQLKKRNIIAISDENFDNYLDVISEHNVQCILFNVDTNINQTREFLRQLRESEAYVNIPIIGVTNLADDGFLQAILDLGADDVYTQPFNVNDIVTEISNRIKRYQAYKQRLQLNSNQANTDFVDYEFDNNWISGRNESSRRKKSILVIEDDIPLKENLIMHLELNGFSVLSAENGMSGIDVAKIRIPDLIICDVMLPDITGFQVLEELNKKKSTSSIPFIFLSAKSELSDIRKGMTLGADSYITKPFIAHKLISLIAAKIEKVHYENCLRFKPTENNISADNTKMIEELIEASKRPSLHKSKDISVTTANKVQGDMVQSDSSSYTEPNSEACSVNNDEFLENENEFVQHQKVKTMPMLSAPVFMGVRDMTADFQCEFHGEIAIVFVNIERAVMSYRVKFMSFVLGLLEKRIANIIIDLNHTQFIDSTFAGALVSSMKKAQLNGSQIKLVMKDENYLSNPILASSITRIFEIYGSIPAAIDSYEQNAKQQKVTLKNKQRKIH